MKPLPPTTVRLLSSSQVITSVGNVVKELLENSMDAGATRLEIKLENYGLDRIEVRDNGLGIPACDTAVMAVRHYTSKISCHDDLERLETYGFRGEALGSVCALAEVSITTKTADDELSTQYSLDSTGKVVSQKPSHLGQGTTVTVLKLFQNLPVRRQYYTSTKKCKEELKKVQDLLMAYAIVKPDLRLTLAHNKVLVWQKPGVADLRGAVLATLGSAAVAHLLPCQHHQERPQISLDGFFPKPGADYSSTSSSSHDKTFVFINDRPVQQKDITKLLRQHYRAQYPSEAGRDRSPVLVLLITLPPDSIDVNLTPDKTKLLLHNKDAVLTALEALLVSLYGYRSPDDPAPPEPDPASGKAPPSPRTDTSPRAQGPRTSLEEEEEEVEEEEGLKPSSTGTGRSSLGVEETGLDHHPGNSSSSSSSVAEDWVVNQIPAGSGGNIPEDGPAGPEDGGRPTPSAESWSGGVALRDTASCAPLRPVQLHRSADAGRTFQNAVTEKRASLTAYDLLSSRASRAPLSGAALFEREARAEVRRERPAASLQEISHGVQQRWKNLGEEERAKYLERAQADLDHHRQRTSLAAPPTTTTGGARAGQGTPQGLKRKAPLGTQRLLDQLFSSPPPKKKTSENRGDAKPWRPLPFNVAGLRQSLGRLWAGGPLPPVGPRLVKRLAPSAWLVLCGRELMLLNPFGVEEALLFKRLLEDNIVAAQRLQTPIPLTDGVLGGSEYTQALRSMAQGSSDLHGAVVLSDPRLLANGFEVTLFPGAARPAPTGLQVTALADCVPCLGLDDLREILTAVLRRDARTVRDSRPLKVRNYLQSEAVRLARQLPSNMTRQEVEESLRRMTQQLGADRRTCVHGRPFFHPLAVVPSTAQEAKSLLLATEEP